jgi:hypothetical protein
VMPAVSTLRFDAHEADPRWSFCHVQSCEHGGGYAAWPGLDKELVSDELPRIPLVGVRLDAPGLLLTLVTALYGVDSDEFNLFGRLPPDAASGSVRRLAHELQHPAS